MTQHALQELLKQFHHALIDPQTSVETIARKRGSLDGDDRLAIYRSSYLGLQTDALTAIYPVVKALTGEDFFRAMAKRYLQSFPSTSGDLHEIGAQFKSFIANFTPASTLPYLGDTAALEWAWHRCFHAENRSEFDFSALSALPEEDQGLAIFQLSPDIHLLCSDFPVHIIWEANQPGNNGEVELISAQSPHHLIIYRDGFAVCIEGLDAADWAFLHAVRSGQALNTLAEHHNIGEQLPKAIARGWIDQFIPPISG